MDAGGLTIMETDSGGRKNSGLRWQAVPGTSYLWLRPSGGDEAEFSYRLRAGMNRAAGPAKGSRSRKACVEFDAANDVNFYDGQAHVIVLSIYPLSSKGGFESASITDLTAGAQVPGLVGEHRLLQLAPGEKVRFEETIPIEASDLGIAADYYQPRAGGEQKIVVDANCSEGVARVHLTRNEVLQD
jgi:type VI secretion system VasD/TssJ family lipoprotein